MANKGNAKREKRVSYSGKGKILRKSNTWVIATAPGPHSKSKSINLGVLLRDTLKIADNIREVKYILANKHVSVNGIRRNEYTFGVGLFDIVNIEESGKRYRMLYDNKGYIALNEMKKDQKNIRYSKILGKKIMKEGKIQINLDNGYNFILSKNEYNVKDTAVYDFVNKKIVEVLPFAKGSTAYVVDGPHVGKAGVIKEIVAGDLVKTEEVLIQGKDGEFRTVSEYIYVIKEL